MKQRLLHVCGDQYLKSFGEGQHLLNARYLPYRRNVIGHSALETFCKMLFYTKLIFYCYISPPIPPCFFVCALHAAVAPNCRRVFTVQYLKIYLWKG